MSGRVVFRVSSGNVSRDDVVVPCFWVFPNPDASVIPEPFNGRLNVAIEVLQSTFVQISMP
jgi:hypothetical protein